MAAKVEDGAGIEPCDDRLCRPMPFHLATRPSELLEGENQKKWQSKVEGPCQALGLPQAQTILLT